jgi:uncharacterized protein involved in type VI secretion and phage assembly
VQENAVVVGIVADLADPEGLGRVRVRYPNYDDTLSNWARIVAPMAGKRRGFRFVPEVGDEVLVLHEQGDKRRPYVAGALWSAADEPPPDDGKPEKNNLRMIVSRSGHEIRLDDTPGAERVEVVAKDGHLRVVLDAAGGRVEITADPGNVAVRAPSGTVSIEADQVRIAATKDLSVEAGTTLTVRGQAVNIN